jgi:hypothetical protein
MAALANKIGNDPVLLSLLDIFNSQRRQFGAPQTASQENGECGVVSLAPETANVYRPKKTLTMLRGTPIANRHTQSFGTLHASNPSRQVGAQEPAIGRLVRQPSDCRKPQVDGRGCIMLRFERNPIPGNHGLVEG